MREHDHNTLLYMACTFFFQRINRSIILKQPSSWGEGTVGERAQLVKHLLDRHEDLNSASSISVECWMWWRRSGDAAVGRSLQFADRPAQPSPIIREPRSTETPCLKTR